MAQSSVLTRPLVRTRSPAWFGWLFLVVLALDLVLLYTLHERVPALRRQLTEENALVENISAVILLISTLTSLFMLRFAVRKRSRVMLIVVAALSALCFLEEVTYGVDLFGRFVAPYYPFRIRGIKIGTLHDFIYLGWREFKRVTHMRNAMMTNVGIGLASLPLLAALVYGRRVPRDAFIPVLFILLFVALTIGALVIDLDIIQVQVIFLFEEAFELNAALALVFAGLSLGAIERQQTDSDAV